jgi:hypothetical protein
VKGDRIRYRRGYKYWLVNDYRVQTDIRPPTDIYTEFIELDRNGWLTIRHGYAWDGCSGPTKDDRTNMRAGLVHDAGYQLIRDGWIDSTFKDAVDRELRKIMLEDGASEIRAAYYYKGVHLFGFSSAKYWSDGGKPLCEAPCRPPGG